MIHKVQKQILIFFSFLLVISQSICQSQSEIKSYKNYIHSFVNSTKDTIFVSHDVVGFYIKASWEFVKYEDEKPKIIFKSKSWIEQKWIEETYKEYEELFNFFK